MNTHPFFSIVIPVYNVAPYLNTCIASVLAQTYQNYEVLLVNDGSTDESGSICEQFAAMDNRLQVIHRNNGGLSAARNTGLDKAIGDYVLFLDSDDFWCTHTVLERIASRLSVFPSQVLSFNYIKYDGKTNYSPYFRFTHSMPTEEQDRFQYLIDHDIWISCAWNKVIQRDLFADRDLRFIEGITSEDMDWCVRLALKADTFDFLDEIVVCYRQRKCSISQSITPKKLYTVLENINRCIELLANSKCEQTILLRPFVAYQYGTMLFHLASLPECEDYRKLYAKAKDKQYLLRWSKNRKIKLLYFTTSCCSLKFTLFLLKLRNR